MSRQWTVIGRFQSTFSQSSSPLVFVIIIDGIISWVSGVIEKRSNHLFSFFQRKEEIYEAKMMFISL